MYGFSSFLAVSTGAETPEQELNAHKRKVGLIGESGVINETPAHLEVHREYQRLKAQRGLGDHASIEAELVKKHGQAARDYFDAGAAATTRRSVRDSVETPDAPSLDEAAHKRHEVASAEAERLSIIAHAASDPVKGDHHNQAVQAHERAEAAHNAALAAHHARADDPSVPDEQRMAHKTAVAHHLAQSKAHRSILDTVNIHGRILGKGHPPELLPRKESFEEGSTVDEGKIVKLATSSVGQDAFDASANAREAEEAGKPSRALHMRAAGLHANARSHHRNMAVYGNDVAGHLAAAKHHNDMYDLHTRKHMYGVKEETDAQNNATILQPSQNASREGGEVTENAKQPSSAAPSYQAEEKLEEASHRFKAAAQSDVATHASQRATGSASGKLHAKADNEHRKAAELHHRAMEQPGADRDHHYSLAKQHQYHSVHHASMARRFAQP